MQAYNHSINDLDKELDHLKSGFEVLFKCFFFVLSAILGYVCFIGPFQ
jgi:hypothetical protein